LFKGIGFSGNILILDSLKLSDIKTKHVENILKSLNVDGQKISFLSSDSDQNFYLSCRNLKNVNLYRAQDVTIHQLMNSNVLVLDETGVEYFNSLSSN